MGNKLSGEAAWEEERFARYAAAAAAAGHFPPPHLLPPGFPPPGLRDHRGHHGHHPGQRPRPRSTSVHPEQMERVEAALNHSPSSGDSPSEPSQTKASRPGTSDSGYATGLDSDPSRRRLRASRVSLNDAAVFSDSSSPSASHHFRRGPPPHPLLRGPPPPHLRGPPGHHPPPHFLGGPPPPQLFLPPQLLLAQPPPRTKKGWRKKGKKGKRSDDGSLRSGSLPPFGHFGPDGIPINMGFRAQSMDNLHSQLLGHHPGGPMPPPGFHPGLPPRHLRPFSSQMDLRGPIVSSPSSTPGVGKKKGPERGRRSAARSERTSVSGESGSRRSREPTHFEEERVSVPNDTLLPPPAQPRRASVACEDRVRAFYEAVPKASPASPDVSESRVEVHRPPPASPLPRSPSPQAAKPLKISQEAQEMRQRNAAVIERSRSPTNRKAQSKAEKASAAAEARPSKPDRRSSRAEEPPVEREEREETKEERLGEWDDSREVEAAMEELRRSWAGQGAASEKEATVGAESGPDPLYAQLPAPEAPDPEAFRKEWANAIPAAFPPQTATTRVRQWAQQHSRDFARAKPLPHSPASTPYASAASVDTDAATSTAPASTAANAANGQATNGTATPHRAPTVADSEIDFSWVLDLENKFKRDGAEEESAAQWSGYTPQHRRSFTRSFGSQKDLRQPSPQPDAAPKARYFGMESSNYGVFTQVASKPQTKQTAPQASVWQPSEVSAKAAVGSPELRSNVRGKAALFEQEAARINHANVRQQRALSNAAVKPRSSSGPAQRAAPRPASFHATSSAAPAPPPDYPAGPPHKGHPFDHQLGNPAFRGPSERKIHQGRREARTQDQGPAGPPQAAPANPRAGRSFEATEFYRKHYQAQRSGAAASRMDGYHQYSSQPSVLASGPAHHRAPCRPITAEWH